MAGMESQSLTSKPADLFTWVYRAINSNNTQQKCLFYAQDMVFSLPAHTILDLVHKISYGVKTKV